MSQGPKILVVDEKPHMLRLIQYHLEKAGYQLIRARNRQEAVEALERETPSLVVVDDFKNAEETGSALSEIKAKESSTSIPIIRMTDTPAELIRQNGGPAAEVILTKPFSPTQLVSEVKKLAADSRCA
jgi:DNA-binding response OmpR family regulator